MKRFLSIVLALCMVFALCACGNDSNNGGSDADSSKYDKISIDLSCNGQSDTANDCIGANLFKQYIEEQSGGAITVTIYNNDQLAGGNMTKGLELVMDGTVQMDIHSTSIISSIDKRLMVFFHQYLCSAGDPVLHSRRQHHGRQRHIRATYKLL